CARPSSCCPPSPATRALSPLPGFARTAPRQNAPRCDRSINEGLKADGLLGRADRLQHGWKNLFAIDQHIDLIALYQSRAEQGTQRSPKRHLIGVVEAGQPF